MPITLKKKGVAVTNIVHSHAGVPTSESQTQALVEVPDKLAASVHMPAEQMCAVGFHASYTHNLGNFNSCKVGLTLTIPCPYGEIDGVYAFAEEWVDGRIGALKDEITESTS
jgi:hypothetical protein